MVPWWSKLFHICLQMISFLGLSALMLSEEVLAKQVDQDCLLHSMSNYMTLSEPDDIKQRICGLSLSCGSKQELKFSEIKMSPGRQHGLFLGYIYLSINGTYTDVKVTRAVCCTNTPQFLFNWSLMRNQIVPLSIFPLCLRPTERGNVSGSCIYILLSLQKVSA